MQETLSELKATQDQLVQSEKLASIGLFAAGIAHEIYNPLMGIINYAQILQDEFKNNTKIDLNFKPYSFLKDKCHAAPIYSCFPWSVKNREFWGTLPLIYWAEEAGLGRLSKCGLLITPQFGTRILLGGLFTTLKLEPNLKNQEEICPQDCFECIDACPVNVIDKNGKVDHNACLRYSGNNPLLALVLNNQTIRERISFETLINTIGVDDHSFYTCYECMRACPLNHK